MREKLRHRPEDGIAWSFFRKIGWMPAQCQPWSWTQAALHGVHRPCNCTACSCPTAACSSAPPGPVPMPASQARRCPREGPARNAGNETAPACAGHRRRRSTGLGPPCITAPLETGDAVILHPALQQPGLGQPVQCAKHGHPVDSHTQPGQRSLHLGGRQAAGSLAAQQRHQRARGTGGPHAGRQGQFQGRSWAGHGHTQDTLQLQRDCDINAIQLQYRAGTRIFAFTAPQHPPRTPATANGLAKPSQSGFT
jgi:hypothetical protein